MRVKSVVLFAGFLAILMVVGSVKIASAEVEIGELGKVFDKFLIGGEVNAFYRYDTAPFYGANIARPNDKSTHFGESFARFSFSALKDLGWTNLTGSMAFTGMATVDQDIYALYKDKTEVDLDWAYVKFGSLFKSPFDLTVGRQTVVIEKGLLIGNGYFNKAAAWTLFQWSFPLGIRLDGNFGPFTTSAFWLRSENYWQEPGLNEPGEVGRDGVEVAGINLHYSFTDKCYAYGGFYRKIDNSDLIVDTGAGIFEAGSDTENFDVGLDLTTGRMAGGIINLEGEFNYQTGDAGDFDGVELDREAFGGFAAGKFTLCTKFSPYLKLHYFYFSGDDDPTDTDNENYDPMFWVFIGWNRWVMGELVGENQLPLTNKQVYIVEVGFAPMEGSNIALMYLNHRLNEPFYVGTPISSKAWADEFNLFTDLSLSANLFMHIGLGLVLPDDAAEEVFGDDEKDFFAQTWFRFYF